jgi:gag-polypeptide of LTR copia-type/Zinc knuckle
MNDDSDMKLYLKLPTFDGKEESWTTYKGSITAYLGGAGLGSILVDGDEVQPDGHVWPEDEDAREAVDAGKLLQKQNRKAAGQLYQSIRMNTTEGKIAIRIIKPYFDSAKNGGYAALAGHFKKAWTALVAWYEVVKRKDEDTLRNEFYTMKMKHGQQPSLFILELEEKWNKLELAGYFISYKKFLERILKALPVSKDGIGQYSIKKAEIQKLLDDIEDDVNEDDEALDEELRLPYVTRKLEKVFTEDVEPNLTSRKHDSQDEQGFYAGGGTTGRCHTCGKIGHYAAKCPQKGKGRRPNFNRQKDDRAQKPMKGKFKGMCHHCKKPGHMKKDFMCPGLGLIYHHRDGTAVGNS